MSGVPPAAAGDVEVFRGAGSIDLVRVEQELRLEQEKPCSHRPVGIFETNRYKTYFLAGHFGPRL